MRNIWAVQGPMPRTCTRRAISSSSESESTSASGTVPSSTFRARSATAAALEPLKPAVRIAPSGKASTPAGESPSANSLRKRPWISVAPGQQVPLGPALFDPLHRGAAVGGVMVLAQLLEQDVRSVVELHVAHRARLVVDVHLLEEWDEGDVGDRFLVVLDPAVALGRPIVVVEGDAGRDDVEDRGASVRNSCLDQRHDLLAVAAERTSDE